MNKITPYSHLHPELILDAIESVGIHCTGSLLALNSYENRVYQVGVEEAAPIIAKFYRPYRWSDEAIREEHQFALDLAKQDIPIVAPLLIAQNVTLNIFQEFRFALFPRQGGRALELDNLEHLEWMGRFIGRCHAIGACQSFQHRLQLNIHTYGYHPYQFLIENRFIPDDLIKIYCRTIEEVLQKIEQLFQQLKSVRIIRLHGDCHAGNVLWNIHGPQIVDLDDCLMGPAIQDIWMLLSGDTEQERSLQLTRILQGYQEFHDFDFREIHLIEALRTLRMIHYSAWLAKRWEDPAFPASFPWFNTQPYWREQLENLQEQILLVDQAKEDINLFSTDE